MSQPGLSFRPLRRLAPVGCALVAAARLLAADTNAPTKAPHPSPSTNEPPARAVAAAEKPEAPSLVVDDTLTGEVARVNAKARFVVLSFPLTRIPEVGQRFEVWRTNGVVGALRISGPQRDETIVADIVSGECQRGDEARERKSDPPAPKAKAE